MTVIKLLYTSFLASTHFPAVTLTVSWFLWVVKLVVAFRCLYRGVVASCQHLEPFARTSVMFVLVISSFSLWDHLGSFLCIC